MNKKISTEERIFMSLVGPSGSGKSQFILSMFQNDVFTPIFDHIYVFYQFRQKELFANFQSLIKQKKEENPLTLCKVVTLN